MPQFPAFRTGRVFRRDGEHGLWPLAVSGIGDILAQAERRLCKAVYAAALKKHGVSGLDLAPGAAQGIAPCRFGAEAVMLIVPGGRNIIGGSRVGLAANEGIGPDNACGRAEDRGLSLRCRFIIGRKAGGIGKIEIGGVLEKCGDRRRFGRGPGSIGCRRRGGQGLRLAFSIRTAGAKA